MNTAPMPVTTAIDDIDRLARKRAAKKMGWLIHASIYVIVNAGLLTISLASGRHWTLFPLLGWGVGLAIHGMLVWFAAPGSDLHGRMVERERQALRQRRDAS